MAGKFDNSIKVGILGGGQLGRMLIQSAIDFDLNIHILDSDPNAPCKYLCQRFVKASFTDYGSVLSFGYNMDLITIEIENVNIQALKELERLGKKVYPQPHIIELIQDKRTQKQFYKENNIPTADFVLTDDQEHAQQFVDFLPALHKLGKGGYDGKGVMPISNQKELEYAFDEPGLLEKRVEYEKEISVIVTRSLTGEISLFPIVEMVFDPVYNLVDYLISPAQVSKEVGKKANDIATKIISKLGMVGILAVEMFLTKEGEVLVNEMAPRPHNSGHHTIKANVTSQYDQHWRAILGLPLGDTGPHQLAAMVNILGSKGHEGNPIYVGLQEIMKQQGIHVHLYGKKTTKPSRKMGHIIILDNDLEKLKKKVKFVKETIQVIA